MSSHRLKIKEIDRPHALGVARPSHFVSEKAGLIEGSEVWANPAFSLYCLDPEKEAVLFIESDDPLAVDRAPFYYQAQVDHAVGLVSMPLSEFHQIASQTVPPPKGIIFVHSVGRCGSTLLSKVLAEIPSVHSLSEPDDLTQMVNLRGEGVYEDSSLKPLLESSIRWRCKPRCEVAAEFLAIKPRSEVMVLAKLLGTCFPVAKHFFLYRDGLAWMRTIFRGFPLDRDVHDEVKNRGMEESWSRTLPMVKEHVRAESAMNPVEIRILGWITCMENYFQFVNLQVPICAARFEDLIADPQTILKGFFQFCEIGEIDWSAIDEVLAKDSQAGTIYDREERYKMNRELTEDLVNDVRESIARRPLLQVPDIRLPATLAV